MARPVKSVPCRQVEPEEYGNWEDARRRIDLLALDPNGRLVVIELKRTDDGGHMELQALRYAAMVSSMDFEDVLTAFTAHRVKHASKEEMDARTELLTFLDAVDEESPVISSVVRIILMSANFGREITTAVLWLNQFEPMDIRCVRLVPYEMEGRVLLDIQQVIPLPEAADYQVQIRRKEAARERGNTADGRDLSRYHVIVDSQELSHENKRNSVRTMISVLAQRGVSLPEIRDQLPDRAFRVLSGVVEEPAMVTSELVKAKPGIEPHRYFTEHPFVDQTAGETYVLFKMWGPNTEPTLARLSAAFPEAQVTFRKADVGMIS